MEKSVVIIDPVGIHARPAAAIVRETSKYANQINLKYNNQVTDAKSILGIMSLGIKSNETITLEVIGDDEENVLNALLEVFVSNKLI